ncbi:RHS domain-containing protein [Ostreibacterium oceani]|uniref:RHS protein conserved region domain-containing protein n=1 Tax=Ostreibacterium oceani TaxID=2654998 RepID=A0A6N7EXD7_9GAMM|nr:RHS domain-containing protein [Ostreibacterium oceani]MPV85797.1 hypothetical protein [Ostreibacterium oceani]
MRQRLTAEFDERGEFIQGYLYEPSSPYTTNPLVKIDKAGDSLSYSYYQNDHLGTPQLLTDKSANVVWQGFYQAFGDIQITTETVKNPLRFLGHKTTGTRFESRRITA